MLDACSKVLRLTVDLELADEGLGEVGGEAGGDACRGLQRRQERQVSHLHRRAP